MLESYKKDSFVISAGGVKFSQSEKDWQQAGALRARLQVSREGMGWPFFRKGDTEE